MTFKMCACASYQKSRFMKWFLSIFEKKCRTVVHPKNHEYELWKEYKSLLYHSNAEIENHITGVENSWIGCVDKFEVMSNHEVFV